MSPSGQSELERMRAGVEETDHALMQLLATRAGQVRDIWAWKRKHGLALYDPAREAEMQRHWLDRARDAGLDSGAMLHLFYALLEVTAPASQAGDCVRLHSQALPAPGGHVEGAPARRGDEDQQQREPHGAERRNGQDGAGHGIPHGAGQGRRPG